MAAFPHGERLELLGSHLLNNNTECQFAWLTCCSRQRVPFPSRQQAAFTVCPWMLQTPTSPPSTVLNAKEETHKEECGRIGSQTLELCTMKNSFHHVAGFLNVISDTDTTQPTIRVRTSDLLHVVIHNGIHLFRLEILSWHLKSR